MSALLKIFYSMAMPLCRKCFSSFSTYVLPLNFFKELGFATVSYLPAFTVCLFELCYCLWLACFHCLPVWILLLLSLICLLSPCACLNSLRSACFHCLPVLLLSDVSGFTAASLLCYCLLFTFSLSDFMIMCIGLGWVGFKHFLLSFAFTLSVLVASLEKLHPSSGLYYKCFTIIMIVAST
jgi:hypothetical protein